MEARVGNKNMIIEGHSTGILRHLLIGWHGEKGPKDIVKLVAREQHRCID